MTQLNKDELDEILALIKIGEKQIYWGKEFGNHVDTEPTILGLRKAKARLNAFIESEISKVEKAYGGCGRCFGKGYATVMQGYKNAPSAHIKYCTCGRGKQLAALMSQGGYGINVEVKPKGR